jgi:hypothetical protein
MKISSNGKRGGVYGGVLPLERCGKGGLLSPVTESVEYNL